MHARVGHFPSCPQVSHENEMGGYLIPSVLNPPTRPVELSTLNSLAYQKKGVETGEGGGQGDQLIESILGL